MQALKKKNCRVCLSFGPGAKVKNSKTLPAWRFHLIFVKRAVDR